MSSDKKLVTRAISNIVDIFNFDKFYVDISADSISLVITGGYFIHRDFENHIRYIRRAPHTVCSTYRSDEKLAAIAAAVSKEDMLTLLKMSEYIPLIGGQQSDIDATNQVNTARSIPDCCKIGQLFCNKTNSSIKIL